jgi:hypothetical protein
VPTDGQTTMYARAPRVLWRTGADRILVRRVGDEALELTGAAALVWSTLDTAQDAELLVQHLSTPGAADDAVTLRAAIEGLLELGILQERR